MAIKWGTARTNGSGNGVRLGYELTQSPGSVGQGTGSVTVTLKLYVGTRASVYDSTNSWSLGGDFSGSGSANISHGSSSPWSGANVTLIATRTRTVTTSYTGTVRTDFSASLSGINAIPGTVSVSGAITTGRRPYQNPAVPTSGAAVRASDTQITVTWKNVVSSSAPVDHNNVDRWDNTSGKWAHIADVSSGESYTDRSTQADRRYRYRVGAYNSSGNAGSWTYSDYVATTPAAPKAPAATKTAAGDIRLNWENQATYGLGVEVWHASNGVWDGARLAVLSGQPTTWTHVDPDPTKTHQYRLKATTTGPPLASAYSGSSKVIQLLTNPNAPTGLSPASTVRDGTAAQVFRWNHNEVDGTDQTAFEIQRRVVGGAWVSTGKINSTASQWTLPAGTYTNGQKIEWQVRTWGLYATGNAYSPWSSTALVTLSTPPTVLIDSPTDGTPVDNSVLTVSWGYFDAESHAQAQWRAQLLDNTGNVIESRSGSGTGSQTTFATALADAGTYTVSVTVSDSTGLWSQPNAVTFGVEYALPPQPAAAATWDPDTGTVIISITNGVTVEGEVDAVSNSVWRSIDGGEWTLVATGVELNTAITDYIPGLNAVNYYKVTAVSMLPSVAESEPVPVVTTDHHYWVWVNAGPGFSIMVRIRDNARLSETGGREKRLQKFQGRTKPVEFVGEQRDRELSLSARFAPESSTPADVRALADLPAPVCIRTPFGDRYFVSTGNPSISSQGVTRELSWTMTEVDHNE